MSRMKSFTKAMDEQAQEAYLLCLELLEKLYNGEKVSQTQLINAVGKAWKIHNRYAEVLRHNIRTEHARVKVDSSREMIREADPFNLGTNIGLTINCTELFFEDDNTSLIDLARELLMEAVDYSTRKKVERWIALEAVHKELYRTYRELRYELKEYTEPPLFGNMDDLPEPEVDTYLAGIKCGMDTTKHFLKENNRFGRWTPKSFEADLKAGQRSIKFRFDQEDAYHQKVLEQYNAYTVEALAKLHGVKKGVARRWCSKGLIEAKQVKGHWLVDKDIAENLNVADLK